MIKYRISKYNPKFRDDDGVYLKNEWTSMSDIGKTFDGKVFVKQEYEYVEKNYLNFFVQLCSIYKVDKINIRKIEIYDADYLMKDIVSLPILYNSIKLKNKKICNVTISQATKFLQYCLREKCWGEIVVGSLCLDIGYEYYLNISSRFEIMSIEDLANKNSLYVENV